jgi:hypothetical protein
LWNFASAVPTSTTTELVPLQAQQQQWIAAAMAGTGSRMHILDRRIAVPGSSYGYTSTRAESRSSAAASSYAASRTTEVRALLCSSLVRKLLAFWPLIKKVAKNIMFSRSCSAS